MTVGGYSTLTVFMPVLISKSAWDGLSDGERQALEDAAAASNIFLEASQREAQEQAIEVFTKAGVKVQELSFEEYSAWLQVAKDGPWKSYRALSPRAADLFELAAAQLHQQWNPPVRGCGPGLVARPC